MKPDSRWTIGRRNAFFSLAFSVGVALVVAIAVRGALATWELVML